MSRFNDKRKKNDTKITFIRFIFIFVLFILIFFVIKKIIKKKNITPPIFYSDTLDLNLYSKKYLRKKVIELETKIKSYDAHITRAKVLEEENISLKKEMGRESYSKGIIANVVTAPNRSFYDTFIIDAGSFDGVAEGATVYAFDSIALGVVTRVSEKSSVVTLFSEPERQTTGNVSSSNLAITLIGRGGGEYEVRMPRDIYFSVGDLITMQNISPSVLAEIKKVVSDPRDPFQKLLAKTPVNLTTLKWVVIR